jgi:hypothetical protein
MVIGPEITLSYAGVRRPAVTRPLPVREVIRVLKKVISWAIVIFIIYYLATDPTGAANFVHHIFNILKSAAVSLTTFFNSL